MGWYPEVQILWEAAHNKQTSKQANKQTKQASKQANKQCLAHPSVNVSHLQSLPGRGKPPVHTSEEAAAAALPHCPSPLDCPSGWSELSMAGVAGQRAEEEGLLPDLLAARVEAVLAAALLAGAEDPRPAPSTPPGRCALPSATASSSLRQE